jgi:dodecin
MLPCPLPARQIAAAVLPSSKPREERMAADSVYKVIELIGTSSESWEKAARTAVERAAESLRDLRIAEVTAQDVQLKDGKVELFRTKLKVSFKYEKGGD